VGDWEEGMDVDGRTDWRADERADWRADRRLMGGVM
jgi:hypothetical protein